MRGKPTFDVGRVYLRDASVATSPGRAGRYHFPQDEYTGVSACGRVMLLEDTDEDPDTMKHWMMCRSNGCRQRYDAILFPPAMP